VTTLSSALVLGAMVQAALLTHAPHLSEPAAVAATTQLQPPLPHAVASPAVRPRHLRHVRHQHPARHHHGARTRPAPAFVAGPTPWSALNAAIARIPSYRSGEATWIVGNTGGTWWGTADWFHDTIYVNPDTPVARIYDVAVHEWSHILSVRDYGGNVGAAVAAMNRTFEGTGLAGPERAADCMAILQGAQWTHYTTCANSAWRASAARLVAGRQL
jgi:hypothetical protein